jgi:hypothetical protein
MEASFLRVCFYANFIIFLEAGEKVFHDGSEHLCELFHVFREHGRFCGFRAFS